MACGISYSEPAVLNPQYCVIATGLAESALHQELGAGSCALGASAPDPVVV